MGTVRANRIPNCKLPDDKALKDKPRGHAIEYLGKPNGVDVSIVVWKDNKSVRLVSTYVGILPFIKSNDETQIGKIPRYDKQERGYVDVDCPHIIKEYNRHMGGVGLLDGLVGRYRIHTKSKDVILRLFYHLIDVAVVNAYVLHKRIHSQRLQSSDVPSKDELLELPIFRRALAESLIRFGGKRGRGRPTESGRSTPTTTAEARNSPLPKMGKRAVHLPDELRFDGIDHWPQVGPKMYCKVCKKPNRAQTTFSCKKCGLNLCLTATKNCFEKYHTQP